MKAVAAIWNQFRGNAPNGRHSRDEEFQQNYRDLTDAAREYLPRIVKEHPTLAALHGDRLLQKVMPNAVEV